MTALTEYIRFMANNFVGLAASSQTYSSAASGFPGANVETSLRHKVWKPAGHFEITASNQNLYINDGSPKTVAVTVGDYTTPSALATQIQTDLNAASSNWTVAYSSTTYKFTISNSGSVTLRETETTNAIWSTLGYTNGTDHVGTSFPADEARNHTEETIIIDLGAAAEMSFFALIGPAGDTFSVSSSATIKLQANSSSVWSSPPLDITLSRTGNGIYHFFDDETSRTYRYWRFYLEDKENALGPEGFEFGHVYLGDYITSTTRNLGAGFEKKMVDPSVVIESEGGAIYFNTKTQYAEFNSVRWQLLPRADKDNFEDIIKVIGRHEPFYVSLDPKLCISDTIDEFTRYVVFKDDPSFTHIHYDTFSANIAMREVI